MYAIRQHICVLIMLLFSTGVYAQKDYSNNSSIVIDEPSLAHVNITGIESLPMTKNDNLHAWFEYSDDNGNYFKKRVIVNAQGATSLHYPKKNLSIDFCEDEWVGNKTTNITIGNWVKQDAFHFKANWLDSFRGGLAVYTTYKFYDDIVKDRPHILERAGITDYSKNVLCHPDGFPCVISLNGEFYGVYAWQLKKHRKNMGMQKDNPVQVWVQVDTYTDSFRSGEVDWDALDIRNPKKATQESKDIICKFAKYNNELSELCSTLSDDAMRQEIEKRYDVASFIDFIIYGLVTSNIDGFGKNVQLFTYDGVKWFVAPYDLDETFGISWVGSFLFPPEWSWISADYRMNESTNKVPYNWIMKYFWTDIDCELDESLVCAKNAHTKNYGRRSGFTQIKEITLYNLDVIISVGYRVKSVQGTRFRQWATSVLKQYLIKGYVVNQQIKLDRYNELKDVVRLMSRSIVLQDKVTTDEYSGLLKSNIRQIYQTFSA